MDGAKLHEYIRLARERAGFDTPVLAARLVGDRLELHLLGGELLTFPLSELQPEQASDGEAPAPTAKVRAPKPKPEPLPVRKGGRRSATRKGEVASATRKDRLPSATRKGEGASATRKGEVASAQTRSDEP